MMMQITDEQAISEKKNCSFDIFLIIVLNLYICVKQYKTHIYVKKE